MSPVRCKWEPAEKLNPFILSESRGQVSAPLIPLYLNAFLFSSNVQDPVSDNLTVLALRWNGFLKSRGQSDSVIFN